MTTRFTAAELEQQLYGASQGSDPEWSNLPHVTFPPHHHSSAGPPGKMKCHRVVFKICILTDFLLQLYSVGYGHINTLQSVLVADQFQEEVVTGHNLILSDCKKSTNSEP